MQQLCPELSVNYPFYFIVEHILSCITTPINILAIYCIVCRSPKNIGKYKWHLLWHQILAATVDLELGLFCLPIYLLPFPIIVPRGLLLYFPFIPTHFMVIFTFLLITGSLGAVVQLFVYRYLKSTGRSSMPPSFICLVLFSYLLFTTPSVGFMLIYEKDQTAFFQRLQQATFLIPVTPELQNYTCITPAISRLPMIVGYSSELIGLFVGLPILVVNLYMGIVCGVLIYATRHYLKGNTISAHTAQLERQFLFNLIIQVIVPVVAVHGPGLFLMFIQARQIYGFEEFGLVSIVMLSCYGALCSLMIILLTPRYRNLVFCRNNTCSVSSVETQVSKIIPLSKASSRIR